MIVLHYTAMTSALAAEERLCDPEFEVSAHYLIGADGQVVQLVDERLRAWHAGAGRWGDVTDVNSRSIGIELDNDGQGPFPQVQMAALTGLMRGIMRRWSIRPERVIGHSDMAPGRKADPGRQFDWHGLARAGLAVWPEPSENREPDFASFQHAAVNFGYDPALPDQTLIEAFRLRFAPSRSGPLTGCEVAAMANLAARFPVDHAGRAA